jgi:phosphatidyl-myo-inositol dimannoside synthase
MPPTRRRRLLTIGHSYCVDLNRRLAHEVARQGDWDVTAVGPARFHGDFAWHTMQAQDSEACAVVPVPVHFSRRVQLMLYGRRLMTLLREPWDLVHCWEEPYVAAAAQVARSVGADVPLVFATFQNIAKQYPPPFNWIERYALGRADGIIAFGRTVFDVVARRASRSIPLEVIPPGVDVDHFVADPGARASRLAQYGWNGGAPVVGFVGRLVPEKGCLRLAAALDRVTTPWRALFVGSGRLEGDLRQWAATYGDRVRIETTVSHHQVAAHLNTMDLLCAPSLTTAAWREQFGRMVIEAFACGVPVVASDSGEIPHVVADAGIIVGERDEDGWVAAIAGLLDQPERRADLGRRGRQRAVASFSWPVVARQHLDFFDRVAGSRRRRPVKNL